MLTKKKALKTLIFVIAAEMLLVGLVTFAFDPFYQYHGPWFGIKQVLSDRDKQVIGSIRNLSYDSILLGSSVTENFDSSFLDRTYNCHTLKVVKGSGSTADLLFYLEKAHEKQELKYVFWGLDLAALVSPLDVTVYSEYTPKYMFTETILDDFPYLFNKDVLFEKIPLMLAYSVTDINTGGHGYDWSDGKNFSAAKAMESYQKPADVAMERDFSANIPTIQGNIQMVLEEINSHPDIEYTVFFPPYSLLMWDEKYTNGTAEEYLYALDEVLPKLVTCENAKVYYFQSDRDIVCNLDNYMDLVHYSPAINQYMLDCMVADEYRVTADNVNDVLTGMRDTYEYIILEGIYQYYDKE